MQDNPFYEIIVTNYLNHKYGYSLGYEDYLNFTDSLCPASSMVTVYNQAEGFLTKCMNVQPRLTMTDSLLEYHYTLYYYEIALRQLSK